jgi:hypothetical protein
LCSTDAIRSPLSYTIGRRRPTEIARPRGESVRMDRATMRWTMPRRVRERRPASPRVMLAWGWIAVVLLFGLYVAVLHHSVQRAEWIRSGQLSANAKAPPHAGYYASISPRAGRP